MNMNNKWLLSGIIIISPLASVGIILYNIEGGMHNMIASLFGYVCVLAFAWSYDDDTKEDVELNNDVVCAVDKLKDRYPNFISAIDEAFEGLV